MNSPTSSIRTLFQHWGGRTLLSLALATGFGQAAQAQTEPLQGCPSTQILSRFEEFGRTGKMPPDLGRWLNDRQAQYIEPYQAFDNVYYVGVCWVSAWLVKTSEGYILIDTLHEPFVDQLIENMAMVGVKPSDLRYVLMTHGHFDHVGGAYKLKPLTQARFVMTQTGWDEAIADSRASQKAPRPWQMLPAPDLVLKDGDTVSLGDTQVKVYETPGHTHGTASYSLDVKDGRQTYHAFVIGGLGLNAIDSAKQVESYIASVDRIDGLVHDKNAPITVHLTTHSFSTGLTEAKEKLKTRRPGDPHPLVDASGFAQQLSILRQGAEQRLDIERKKEAR